MQARHIRARQLLATLLLLSAIPRSLLAQDADKIFATVSDGHVAINGNLRDVAGLQVASAGGNLSLETLELPGGTPLFLRTPFPANAVIVANEPDGRLITLGILGSDRVQMEGLTQTAIRYSEPLSVALTDLAVDIGADLCGAIPATLPIGSEAGIDQLVCDGGTSLDKIGHTGVIARFPYYASVEDGQLALNGPIQNLGALHVTSNTPTLSLGDAKLPFGSTADVEINTPQAIKFGVLQSTARIHLEGQTITSVAYSGADPSTDLQVTLGLGQCGATAGQIPIGPIESSRNVICDNGGEATVFSDDGGIREQRYVSLVDGQVALNGTFPRLGGIYASSQDGLLSLDDTLLPFGTDAFVRTNTPQEVKFGVATPSNRVSLEGQTLTSIQYAGTESGAASDLRIEVGLDTCGVSPWTLGVGEQNASRILQCNTSDAATSFTPFGGVSGDGIVGGEGLYATVLDGNLVLNGRFEGLSGIDATTESSRLTFDRSSPTAPFTMADAMGNASQQVSLRVLRATDRVTVEGVTKTAIRYPEDSRTATEDLAVDLRIEACNGTLASLPIGIDAAIEQV